MQVINGIEEKVLINRIIRGDQTAFELVFRFYYPGLVVFASQITLDRREAEEIVQDFFVRFWTKRSNLHEAGSVKSYFFTSVRNSSLNFLKREKVKEKLIGELKQLMKDNLLYDPDLYIQSVLQDDIRNAFEKLPPKTREVFMMSRFRGKKNDEIANELNLSKRTVETHITHALKILREELKDYLMMVLLL
jgi:RNA polymerase sigma-70 factor (ECF subfamily)